MWHHQPDFERLQTKTTAFEVYSKVGNMQAELLAAEKASGYTEAELEK